MKINNFKKKLLCWGGADQCIVINPIIEALGSKIDVIIDDTPNLPSPIADVPVFQGENGLNTWLQGQNRSEIGFIIAIGNPYGFVRTQLHKYLLSLGLTAITICDKSCIIDKDVTIADGAQIMRGVIVNAQAKIGTQCILNTKSLIEHHCQLGDGVEIGPSAVLTGRVKVGNFSWICAGTTIIPRVTIGENTIIGAGAVVTADVAAETVAVGVPAKILKQNNLTSKTYAR